MSLTSKRYLSILLCVACAAAMPVFCVYQESTSTQQLFDRIHTLAEQGDCSSHLATAKRALGRNDAVAPELMNRAIDEAMSILEKHHAKIASDTELKAIMRSLEAFYKAWQARNISIDDDATIDGNLHVHGVSEFDGQIGIGRAPSAYALDVTNNNGSRFVGPYNHTQAVEQIRFEKPFEAGVSNAVYGSINFGNVDAVLGGERGTITLNVSPSWDASPTEALRIHGGDTHEVIASGHLYATGVVKGSSVVAQNTSNGNQQCSIGWDNSTNRGFIGAIEQNVAFRDLELFIPGSPACNVYANGDINVAANANIAGSAYVNGTVYTNQPVAMGAHVAAGSYNTATRIEWARVDADGTLLDHSAGVASVNKTGAGLYEITLIPGMIISPAVLVSTELPALSANYSIVSSDASQTVLVINSNGIDTPFSFMSCGLQ